MSEILKEVITDRRDPSKVSSSLMLNTHLAALDGWRSELPLYLCLRSRGSPGSPMLDLGANNRQKTGIVRAQFPARAWSCD